MVEEIVQEPNVQAQNGNIAAELAQQMAISLNGGIEPQVAEPPAADQPPAGATDTTQTVVTNQDTFGVFKEKFGYQTAEDAIKEIEEFRALKSTPTTTPEFKFENEDSKRLAHAIAAGKKSEVYQLLDQEMKLERLTSLDVNKDTAEEIVKVGMQLKYKDLTTDEVNYKFNQQFKVPAKPVQSIDEDDDAFVARTKNWEQQVSDKQMELMIEAKLLKPTLAEIKSKLVLPEIQTSVDQEYLDWKKSIEVAEKQQEETVQAYKSLTPKAIETKLNFKDEANKIDFEFQFEPDAEGFQKAVAIASDINAFYQLFMNSDGSPNRQKFLDAIYYTENKSKILFQAMNQAKNAAIKSTLPDNSQGGLTRQITQDQPQLSELEANMRASLKGYGGF